MKVKIVGIPKFYFEVPLGLVKDLLKCSKTHYDGACQRASAVVGAQIYPGMTLTHTENGILRIWFNRFETGSTDDAVAEVSATWGQLDLISKICENSGVDGIDVHRVSRFAIDIRRIYAEYGRCLADWQREVTL